MTRNWEGLIIGAACVLAAFAVALVNFAQDRSIDAQVALTFLVFLIAFGGLHLAVRAFAPRSTPLLLPLVTALTGLGFFEIYRLDLALETDRAALQRWWILIGSALAALVLALLNRSSLSVLRRYRNLTLAASLLFLLLPLLPAAWSFPLRGLELNGSRLWVLIDLGFTRLQFQPAELAKLGLVAYVAAYLADHQRALREARRRIGWLSIPEPRQLIPLLVTWGISVLILISQRDLGASLLLFVGFVLLLYAATGTTGYLAAGGLLTLIAGVTSYLAFEYVQRRVVAWLSPFLSYEDEGYQIAQGLFALGTGSLSGAGPGLGRPDLIPNAATDFIFAAVGEELGFAGTVVVLALFALLTTVGLGIAFRSREVFRKLLAAGLTFVLAVQVLIIIGGIVRLLPLTGITLPFMSYGGSALVGNLILIALLLRISHEEAT